MLQTHWEGRWNSMRVGKKMVGWIRCPQTPATRLQPPDNTERRRTPVGDLNNLGRNCAIGAPNDGSRYIGACISTWFRRIGCVQKT